MQHDYESPILINFMISYDLSRVTFHYSNKNITCCVSLLLVKKHSFRLHFNILDCRKVKDTFIELDLSYNYSH